MDRRTFLLSSSIAALQAKVAPTSALMQVIPSRPEADLAERLKKDPMRPQYHLLPQAGFLGDPCAPRFYGGNYHAFFHGNYGGRGWQHAMSADLVHWRHMPIALSPTTGGYDSYGTFTGGVLPGGEGASVVYTGVTKVPRNEETIRAEGLREVQCIATSTDEDLRAFVKRDKPVIDGPPPGLKVTGFRDPFGWKDGDTWYLAVGSGFPQVGGAVLLYRSRDMQTWEYLHPLAQGVWNGISYSNPVPSGEMWECPDFFQLGDKHVLLYSTEHTTRWEVGTYDKTELRFHAEKKGILDLGAYYAPRSMADASGRRILWGWVQETRSAAEIQQAGWSGCMSLPRVLSLGPDNALMMDVPPEIEGLRQSPIEIERPPDAATLNEALSHATLPSRAGEIVCAFRAGAGPCSLEVHVQSASGPAPLVSLAYSQANGAPFVAIGDKLLPLRPDSKGVSTMHLWIDGSVIEIFLDSRQAMTVRSYAQPGETGELHLAWKGEPTLLQSLKSARMAAISPDRLTT